MRVLSVGGRSAPEAAEHVMSHYENLDFDYVEGEELDLDLDRGHKAGIAKQVCHQPAPSPSPPLSYLSSQLSSRHAGSPPPAQVQNSPVRYSQAFNSRQRGPGMCSSAPKSAFKGHIYQYDAERAKDGVRVREPYRKNHAFSSRTQRFAKPPKPPSHNGEHESSAMWNTVVGERHSGADRRWTGAGQAPGHALARQAAIPRPLHWGSWIHPSPGAVQSLGQASITGSMGGCWAVSGASCVVALALYI